MRKGFTLIELLVVVGILGILAVAALVAINPAEAQRKSRDTVRLKDMATLQTALEQFINDQTGALPATWTVATVLSNAAAGAVDCAANWTGQNLCAYLRQVPRDPVNRLTNVVAAGPANTAPVNALAVYTLNRGNGVYKICTRLESESNRNKLNNVTTTATEPGGVTATGFATGSDMALTCGY